jgi:phenylacetate-CoA ligase
MAPASSFELALDAFRRAAKLVPAYRCLLDEAGIRPDEVTDASGFSRVPILDKQNTFQRFGIEELCAGGRLGPLASVLTSSGHSGVFAFGVYDHEASRAAEDAIDDVLDTVHHVRSRPTLLINCLPMGVKVPTRACTLAETSVRPDMAAAVVKTFAARFEQTILVGDAAFIKHLLEFGEKQGIDWHRLTVHVFAGEEPLAENARRYIGAMLGVDVRRPETGLVVSSMGIGELGLNLFSEVPPVGPIVGLRRLLHESSRLRRGLLGQEGSTVPMLFSFDPTRIYVEFADGGRLVITTLDGRRRIPLIRYAPGDVGGFLELKERDRPELEGAGLPFDLLSSLPLVMVTGRGKHAMAGDSPVWPDEVKEGIYLHAELAQATTANFRLLSGRRVATVRIQLSPGVEPGQKLEKRFAEAIAQYVRARLEVRCERYEQFGSGMALDYERKFDYLGA